MSMTISILGGVGLFLLGMTVMTGGLKTLAGPALRTVLGKAAATPLRGAFWGTVVTLLVQSSSATTMTTMLESKDDQRRLTSTLHGLDHASRLAETAGGEGGFETASNGSGSMRAVKLCAEAMKNAALIAGEIAAPATARHAAAPKRELPDTPSALNTNAAPSASAGAAIVRLEHCAKELDDLQRIHRSATLSAAADGELTVGEAMARVDAVRRLAALGHHAWRAAVHLAGWGT